MGCRVDCSVAEAMDSCKVVIIAVAPQHLRALGGQILKKKTRGGVVISTVAGVSGVKISKLCGVTRVIRTVVDLVQLPVAWSHGDNVEEGDTDRRQRDGNGNGNGDGNECETGGGNSKKNKSAEKGAAISVTSEMVIAGAKSFITESNVAELARSSVESMAMELGFSKGEAERASSLAVYGDGDEGVDDNDDDDDDACGEGGGNGGEGDADGGRRADRRRSSASQRAASSSRRGSSAAGGDLPEISEFLSNWKKFYARGFWEILSDEVFAKDLPAGKQPA